MITSEDIISIRKDKKWTQQELAEYLGAERKSVNRWENGKTHPLPIFRDKLKALQEKQQPK